MGKAFRTYALNLYVVAGCVIICLLTPYLLYDKNAHETPLMEYLLQLSMVSMYIWYFLTQEFPEDKLEYRCYRGVAQPKG